jgi:hypothetical protein
MKTLSKEVKDVYTGYFIQITLSAPSTANPTIGSYPFLLSLRKAGINSKIYAYNASPIGLRYVFEFMFFICPSDLDKLYKLLGQLCKKSGTLNEYPGLEDLSAYYTPVTEVKVEIIIREAVVIDTKGSPSSQLRTSVLKYVIGSGFTVTFFSILGNSIILDSVPRDIKANNNAKLMIGSILPVLGHMQDCQCEEICQGKVRRERSSSEEFKRRHKRSSSEEIRKLKHKKHKNRSFEEYKHEKRRNRSSEELRNKKKKLRNKNKHISAEEFKWTKW